MKEFFFKKRDIDLIVYDFDGVMTDNKVVVDENGKESVIVNRGDGLAIAIIKSWEIPQIIMSTETNEVVQKRAQKLKIPCLNSITDKRTTLSKYLKTNTINSEKVIYIGNDINDLEAMEIVGYPITPFDAAPEVKKIAYKVLSTKGGDGVIRELIDHFD
jgi:3-deoxy-D-manno-octulosonate 8-phosphate phosphatase (KDO 8-P phosphatase)